MRISALEEYGLRCAIQLARVFGNGHLPASKISEVEGISVEYVGKLMHLFRKSNLVVAVRGIQGGFALSKSPSQVYLKEIFDAVRGKKGFESSFCQQFSGHQAECVHVRECSVRPVWALLSYYFDDVLQKVTLQDLMSREYDVEHRVHGFAADQAKAMSEQLCGRKEIQNVAPSIRN